MVEEEAAIAFQSRDIFSFGLLNSSDGSTKKHYVLSFNGVDAYSTVNLKGIQQIFYKDGYFYGHIESTVSNWLRFFKANLNTQEVTPSVTLVKYFDSLLVASQFTLKMVSDEHIFVAAEIEESSTSYFHTFLSLSMTDFSLEWYRNISVTSQRPMGPTASIENGQKLYIANGYGSYKEVFTAFFEFTDKENYLAGPNFTYRLHTSYATYDTTHVLYYCYGIYFNPSNPLQYIAGVYSPGANNRLYLQSITFDGLNS